MKETKSTKTELPQVSQVVAVPQFLALIQGEYQCFPKTVDHEPTSKEWDELEIDALLDISRPATPMVKHTHGGDWEPLGALKLKGSETTTPTATPESIAAVKCETNVFWTAGGINFKTDRSTFEKHYTPKNAPQKEVPGLKTPPRDFLGEWETTLSQIRQLLLETPLEVMPSKQVTKALGAWKTLKQCVRDSV